ncbi:hypothetical protein DE146DRAFT_218172 [Phaeosphaeria sp. MPI-PUGE-AT-0046c]|nr:hypothetical protein DE146DRAFT_218172 [Phaeosphaeria sp. MPI-PUGE-AT-0046c]
MPRLGHKKSRLGCRQCKARHVKCDELKPCSNCARHGVPCSLVTWDPHAQGPPPAAATVSGSSSAPGRVKEGLEDAIKPDITSTPSPSTQADHGTYPPKARGELASAMSEESSPSSQSDHFPFLTRFIHRTDQTDSDLWLRDLELMHHWTVAAYDELSQRDDISHAWRIDAPKHAVDHAFFMHEILAFSALHKAHKTPDQRSQYYAYGVHHQDLTIRGIREKLLNVTPYEAPAIVATSTLLTLSVFASTGFELNYPEVPSSQGAIEGILNIFNLMQGMGNVLALAQVHVVNSFLGPIYRESSEAIPSQPMLEELCQRIPAFITFLQSRADLNESERRLYLGLMSSFDPVLKMSMAPCVDNRELRFLFLWPMQLHADFFNLLRQRHAGALAITMFYSTILFASQSRYCFMEGWGKQLMRACYNDLDQDWHAAVQWPASFLHENPTWNLFSSWAQQRHGPGIPLVKPDPVIFAYTPRSTMEISHRPQAKSSPGSRGTQSDTDATFAQQDAASRLRSTQGAGGASYATEPGPPDHGR